MNWKGEAGICRARKSCPFGDLETEHFATADEARAAYESNFRSFSHAPLGEKLSNGTHLFAKALVRSAIAYEPSGTSVRYLIVPLRRELSDDERSVVMDELQKLSDQLIPKERKTTPPNHRFAIHSDLKLTVDGNSVATSINFAPQIDRQNLFLLPWGTLQREVAKRKVEQITPENCIATIEYFDGLVDEDQWDAAAPYMMALLVKATDKSFPAEVRKESLSRLRPLSDKIREKGLWKKVPPSFTQYYED